MHEVFGVDVDDVQVLSSVFFVRELLTIIFILSATLENYTQWSWAPMGGSVSPSEFVRHERDCNLHNVCFGLADLHAYSFAWSCSFKAIQATAFDVVQGIGSSSSFSLTNQNQITIAFDFRLVYR